MEKRIARISQIIGVILIILLVGLGIINQSIKQQGQKGEQNREIEKIEENRTSKESSLQTISTDTQKGASTTRIRLKSNNEVFTINILPTDNMEDVLSFITDQLDTHGWQIDSLEKKENEINLAASKGNEELILNLLRQDGKDISVQLSVSSKESGQE